MGKDRDNNLGRGRHTEHDSKIGLFINRMTETVLSFPFKDCILEGGMTKEEKNGGREERFFSESMEIDRIAIDTLKDRKVLTNFSVIDIKGEKKVKSEKDVDFFDEDGNLKNNLLIKGNNLLSLYSLKERFGRKIKMIYIDPPYNTGGDINTFTYNNSFNHSTWLVFMKNRLEAAKGLLREDGFIAIAIDHYELFYLGVLADEIFGRDNRVGTISVEIKPEGRTTKEKGIGYSNEFYLIYAKNIERSNINSRKKQPDSLEDYKFEDEISKYKLRDFMRTGGTSTPDERPNSYYPIYFSKKDKKLSLKKTVDSIEIYPIDSNGKKRVWCKTPNSFLNLVEEGSVKVELKKDVYKIYTKERIKKETNYTSFWHGKRYNSTAHGTNLLKKLISDGNFSYPKSLYSVIDVLQMTTSDNDIILDFFAGSGTTGHAALALNAEDGGNRKFILCEQIDEHFDVCKERLGNVLKQNGTMFSKQSEEKVIAFELKRYNQIFVDGIKQAKTKKDLEEVYGDMRQNAFLQFWFDKKEFESNGYTKKDLEGQKKDLLGILDFNQLYLNYPEIEDTKYKVSQIDRDMTHKFYGYD